MSPFASIAGATIDRLHFVIPALGIWHADVSLSQAPSLSGPQTLLLAGSSWSCTPIRSIAFAGSTSARLVAGAAGWRKSVAPQQYSSPAGVPTATVLADAASLVGELPPVLAASVPATVGTGYVRQAGAASLVLQDLESRGVLSWWVDAMGIVQTMPRPSPAITSSFVAEAVAGAVGWYRIATETPGDWQPGATFSGPTVSGTVNRVEHRISGLKFWTEMLVA